MSNSEEIEGESPEDALPRLSDEWLTEIARRTAEFEAGNVMPVPWEEVRDAAWGRLSRENGT